MVWAVGTPVRALVTRRLGLIELSSSRGLGLRIGTVKCRFLLGRNETEVKATTEAHLALTSVDTMDTQKRKRDEYESDLITYMRMGNISILDALVVKLSDVFTAEILPKLDMNDTLNLAQVNKTYNAAVWSVDGVRSLEEKIKARRARKKKPMLWPMHPMFSAAYYGNLPAVRALLESGVDVNKSLTTKGRTTALMLAAMCGYVAIVKLLIEKGADLNMVHLTTGATALYRAAEQYYPVCVMELLKAGADVNIANNDGQTPLMVAVKRGSISLVALLIHYGADVNVVDNNGMNPLALTACNIGKNSYDRMVALLKGTDHLKT